MTRGPTLAVVLLLAACQDSSPSVFRLTAPTQASTPASPSPQPPALPPPPPTTPPFLPTREVTSITVGETITRTIETPSECFDYLGWPCQYFQFTSSRTGNVVIDLRYVPDTQPPGRSGLQGVDVSVTGGAFGEQWAQTSDATSTMLIARVTADTQYTIALWYTFPRLEYTLHTEYRE